MQKDMMKKVMIIGLLMSILTVIPAGAQILFGVRGGLSTNKLSIDADNFSSKTRYGWFVGPALNIKTPLRIGVDIAALYNQRTSEINGESFTQKTVEVPVSARLNLDFLAGSGIYLALGPQFAFNVGNEEFKWNERTSYENTFQLKKSVLSWNFGAGLMLTHKLEIGVIYNAVIGKTGDIETISKQDKIEPKAKSLNFTASWYF